jgi:hypothetical protein
MTLHSHIAIVATAVALLATNAAHAQSGPGSHSSGAHHQGMGRAMGEGRGPVGMLTTQDANSATDMGVTMNLVHANTKIQRAVTRLPDGIKTVTESSDPKTAQDIKAHVASMFNRLQEGKEFNIFSTTLPVIFDNVKTIKSNIEFTANGAIVIQTSPDPKVALALQAHADEVTELVKGGPAAFHRGIASRAAMGLGGPRGASRQ